MADGAGRRPGGEGAPVFGHGQGFHEGGSAVVAGIGLHEFQEAALAFRIIGGGAGETAGVTAFPVGAQGRHQQAAIAGDGQDAAGHAGPRGGLGAGDGFVGGAGFIGVGGQVQLVQRYRAQADGQAFQQPAEHPQFVGVAGGEEYRRRRSRSRG